MEERRNVRDAMAEAAAKPLDFDPKTRAKYIRDMVAKIETYQAQNMTVEEIQKRVPVFVRDYKNLFEMVTAPTYNKQNLKTMLAMLDRMGSGELSQHQASVIVGKQLADKYIKPETQDGK